jgi:hypothetical protein
MVGSDDFPEAQTPDLVGLADTLIAVVRTEVEGLCM